jgi:hypothetical protein
MGSTVPRNKGKGARHKASNETAAANIGYGAELRKVFDTHPQRMPKPAFLTDPPVSENN